MDRRSGPGSRWRGRWRPRRVAVVAAVLLLVGVFVIDLSWFYRAPAPSVPISERAWRLHREAIVIDLHADSMLWDRDMRRRNRRGHLDYPRMREGGVDAVGISLATGGITFANSVHRLWPLRTWTSRWAQLDYQVAALARQLTPGEAQLVRTAAEVRENHRRGVLSFFHGIEGAHALDGDLGRLTLARDRGVLYCAPVHFFDNAYGGHGGGDGRGLSAEGRRLLARMNELGLLLDTAHASSATIRDAVALSAFPPINSHSGVKGIKDHWRNLSDEDLRVIAARGGVVGVMYGGWATHTTRPEEVVDHMAYIIRKVGEDHVGLGSDWDGFIKPAVDAVSLPQLTELMLRRGWSETRVRKILGENVLRVWAERDRLMQARAAGHSGPR